jgi:hypothetical protein
MTRARQAMRERRVKVTASLALALFGAACAVPVTTVIVDNRYPRFVVYSAFWQAVSFQVPIPPGYTSAPLDGGTNHPDCPLSYVELQADTGCTESDLRCEYPQAVCQCAGNLNGPSQPDGGLRWFCDPDETVPASASSAYAVVAPGWDPESAASPTSFVVLQSRDGFSVQVGETLQIPVDDSTFIGNCASGSFLSQSQADFITQRIFPSIFANRRYDAAKCETTPVGDAGGP